MGKAHLASAVSKGKEGGLACSSHAHKARPKGMVSFSARLSAARPCIGRSPADAYSIELLRADMTKPLPFESESFELIFHPVSNYYVQEVFPIWKECFRILRKGGVLRAGVDNGINFIFDEEQKELKYALPYQPLQNPELFRQCMEQGDALQFSHTTEDQLRTLLQAGFQLEDIYEDTNGTGRLHEFGVPTFLAFLARKPW